MPSEETLLLWVLCASNDRQGSLCPAYARTEIEARQQCNEWIIEQAMLGLKDIEVKHYPGGFLAGQSTWCQGVSLRRKARQAMPAPNNSEVAQLMRRIRDEHEAAQSGLTGVAEGAARHSFINAHMERIWSLKGDLAREVGDNEAAAMVYRVMDEVGQ
jgi:hypothetical protein